MYQTGQAILMPLFESTRGISLQWLDRLLYVVVSYLVYFQHNRQVELNGDQTHTHAHSHICAHIHWEGVSGIIWSIAAGRGLPTQIYVTSSIGQVASSLSLSLTHTYTQTLTPK